ncbi:MAG: hypothetical protein MI919_27385, partial [Holophagales bacterium]|nr:hypothetical protein [Holophagales bacterium]
NDHWIGFGVGDRTVAQIKRIFSSRVSRLRLVQLATKAILAWRARDSPFPNRVSLRHFDENLRSMAELARDAGAVPMFLTAPSNHHPGEEPEGLERRWLRDASELVPLHQSYVEVVRTVARDTRSPLCDLAGEIEKLSRGERDRLFTSDGIHLTPSGDRHLAALIFTCLDDAGLWPRILPQATTEEPLAEGP